MQKRSPRQLRKVLDISQKDAAKGIGISRSYYNEIENGERVPSYAVAHKIARFYKVSIDEVVFPAFEYADRENAI